MCHALHRHGRDVLSHARCCGVCGREEYLQSLRTLLDQRDKLLAQDGTPIEVAEDMIRCGDGPCRGGLLASCGEGLVPPATAVRWVPDREALLSLLADAQVHRRG